MDDSPNNRGLFPDDLGCNDNFYGQFIGGKDFAATCSEAQVGNRNDPCAAGGLAPDGIILRVDVDPGSYRFVAAVGDAENHHAHRILAEDGGAGPPSGIGPNHVVLVHNFDQAQQPIGEVDPTRPARGVFARVGFDGRIPPVGDKIPPDPQFVNMDENGMATAACPSSPTLQVTQGYIRIHQLQGNSNDGCGGARDPNGGDMVVLEVWRVGGPAGGKQMPGDCNGDGVADLTDAVCLLTHLFTGDVAELPCGGTNVNGGDNMALLNFNGDGSGVDITDAINLLTRLFLGGEPHVLGEQCRTFAGCPSNAICR
jgi:hypothetical protein